MNKQAHNYTGKQKGVALFTALMMLLIVTIIGIASVRTGVMEAQMAASEELRVSAFETAESIVDAVIVNAATTLIVLGNVGRASCHEWPTAAACDDTIELPAELEATVANQNQLQAKVVRREDSPPTFASGTTDCIQFSNFRIEGRYDGRATGQGNTEVRRGVRIPVPLATSLC